MYFYSTTFSHIYMIWDSQESAHKTHDKQIRLMETTCRMVHLRHRHPGGRKVYLYFRFCLNPTTSKHFFLFHMIKWIRLLFVSQLWKTVKTNMNYTLMVRPLISTSCSSIHQRSLSSPCVYCIRERALVSFHCGAADGWGMISGGDKPLWGNTAANRPSTTAKHPVSRRQAHSLIEKLFFGTESQRGVNISTSVLHMHRWLQTGNTELSEVRRFPRTSSQTRVVVESLVTRLISLLCL